MLNKTFTATVLLATAAISTSAMAAGDRDFNTAAGAVVGAAIGSNNGPGGALVGGVLGAAVGNSLSGHGRGRTEVVVGGGYAPAYYGRPAPVYYEPAPRYYAPAPVVYVEPGRPYYGGYYDHRGYYDHGYRGYDRGYDHGHYDHRR